MIMDVLPFWRGMFLNLSSKSLSSYLGPIPTMLYLVCRHGAPNECAGL